MRSSNAEDLNVRTPSADLLETLLGDKVIVRPTQIHERRGQPFEVRSRVERTDGADTRSQDRRRNT